MLARHMSGFTSRASAAPCKRMTVYSRHDPRDTGRRCLKLLNSRAIEEAPPRVQDACRRAAALLEGAHDFTQFATLAPGAARDPVKRVSRCAVVPEGGGALRVEVVGGAFLWKMVRHMVRGTLTLIGYF